MPTFFRFNHLSWLTACLCALLLAGGCASKTPSPPPGAQPQTSVQQSPASEKAASVIRLAYSLIGARYQWGGESPREGFDCSGLVWYVFHQNGVNLPRISYQQFAAGRAVSRTQLRPGDLVFHHVDKKGKSLHVGIVTTRGTFIHSPSSGKRVMETSLSNPYWLEHYIGARRVL